MRGIEHGSVYDFHVEIKQSFVSTTDRQPIVKQRKERSVVGPRTYGLTLQRRDRCLFTWLLIFTCHSHDIFQFVD